MRTSLLALLFALLSPALAHGQDTVTVGGATKRAFGTPLKFVNGDTACFITLRDDKGATFDESADFELCAQERTLKGKRVALTYKASRVQAASCQGDPNCKRSDTVVLIVAAKPAPLAAASPPPPAARQTSFCTPMENVIFSCRTGAKMVSACASKDAAPGKGYLQYRFGKPDSADPLELILPESQLAPSRVATGTSVPFAGGGGAWLTFAKGQVTYTLYTGIGKWGPGGELREKAGLAVDQGRKRLAVLKCDNPKIARSEIGPDWFGKVGIKAGADFDFPD
jgi:hypothetical protein